MNFLYSLLKVLEIENYSKRLSLKDLKLKSSFVVLKRDFEDKNS